VAAVGVLVLAAIAAAAVHYHLNYVPADLDLSAVRRSARGAYQVGYVSRRTPIPINQIHAWTLHVATADGRPVEHAAVRIDGKMPQHIHGLPTKPQVTKELGNGDYAVDGLKFNMAGWWVIDFAIESPGERDVVRFNLLLR
jgi:hypothetical protein